MRFSETIVKKSPEQLAFDKERHTEEFCQLAEHLWNEFQKHPLREGVRLEQVAAIRDAIQNVKSAFFYCDSNRIPKAFDQFEKAILGLFSDVKEPLPLDLEGQKLRWAREIRTAFSALCELDRAQQIKNLSREAEKLIEEADSALWFRGQPMSIEEFGDRISRLWQHTFLAIVHKWGVRR